MSTTREIKRRIRGINSIKQITNAMELVSTAKLRKARRVLEQSRPYYETVLSNIRNVIGHVNENHYLLVNREIENRLYIVLTSDRGLAGGYNANVLRLAQDKIGENKSTAKLLVVGTKARDFFTRRDYNIIESYTGISETPTYKDAKLLGKKAMELFKAGEVDEINLVFTRFESTISYTPKVLQLLPSEAITEEEETKTLVEFEPSSEAVLDYLIPKYIESSIYGALIEASASEQGSRRVAMEAATDNANDMIGELETNYNRARQAAITNEITEIVSGADALT
ncbi:MAG: ATP synthase F1 subunit gamma [Tissierellia bacterium]|nr:ATP synthase F1 subunit gamma [Tissierellia bacterium]